MFKGKSPRVRGRGWPVWSAGQTPEVFENHDMVIVRYEGTERRAGHAGDAGFNLAHHNALPRERAFVVGLMTDARFSGGSVGLVIGHVGPEAAVGGPIALIENGDEIVADLNTNELNCTQLQDSAVKAARQAAWDKVVAANGGLHPNCGVADTRLLHRMRASGVPATQGGGMHPNANFGCVMSGRRWPQASRHRTSTTEAEGKRLAKPGLTHEIFRR